MSEHDLLCPAGAHLRVSARGRTPECQCPLIEDVRADEGDVLARMEQWFTQQGLGVLELRRALGRIQ